VDRFAGLTVRERLFEQGTLDEFDDALIRRDAQTVRRLLEQVEVDEPSISHTIINMSVYAPR
jgi:hypothetical protein